MDESTKTASPSLRHRLDSGSAANRPMQERHAGYNRSDEDRKFDRASVDGPRADGMMAAQELKERRSFDEAMNTKAEPRVDRLGFDEALQILRRGGRVARTGWNGRGQFLALAVGASAYGRGLDAAPIRTHILIHPVEGDLVPWVASQTDLLAFDWCLVREEKVLVYGSGDATGTTGTSDVGG